MLLNTSLGCRTSTVLAVLETLDLGEIDEHVRLAKSLETDSERVLASHHDADRSTILMYRVDFAFNGAR